MDITRIKHLLERYYSGDISPDDYQELLSFLKENNELPPELETECRMLLAVDALEPVMPEGLKERLEAAVDRKQNRARRFFKVLISGAAAAILLLCITIAMHYENIMHFRPESDSKSILADRKNEISNRPTVLPKIQDNTTESASQLVSEARLDHQDEKFASKAKNSEQYNIDDSELERAAQIADDALLDIISSIRLSRKNVSDRLEEIEIKQNTDF